MLDHYADIRERIAEDPQWWDRHGCPRYCTPEPGNHSHVYADKLAFMRIACQQCGHEFVVEFATSRMEEFLHQDRYPEYRGWDPLTLHYGDPPNIECCSAGNTMNSCPRELIGAWERERFDWVQTHANVPVRADWDAEE